MIPILYSESETQFETNGIGRLKDAISCLVTEERNGEFEMEMEYPVTGKYFNQIKVSNIISAVPSDGKEPEPFRIYKISKPLNGVCNIFAEHISYQLASIPVMPFTANSFAEALQGLVDNAAQSCPFTVSTRKTTTGKYTLSQPKSFRSCLGGEENSLLDVYGTAEYEFRKWTITAWTNRGTDTGIVLRYGKNITDIQQEENIENTITAVCPYWISSETQEIVTIPQKIVQNSNASNFPYLRTEIRDFSQDFQTKPTATQLRQAALSYIQQSGIGVPSVNITLSFVPLWQTMEYKELSALERINLCDTIKVYFEKLGITAEAKVIKTVYDVLKDRYDSIQVGDAKTTLASAIVGTTSGAIEKTARTTRDKLRQVVDYQTKLITGGLGGYVVMNTNADGEPFELLIMDSPDVDTATNILRMNLNGIAFSNNGYNGPYKQAWTIDGTFNTDFIFSQNITATGTITGLKGDFTGKITTGSGSVGGWGITSTLLQKYTEEVQNGDQYNVFMQAPVNPTTVSRAFGVQKRTFTSGEAGDWSNVFYVDYSGKLYAKNVQIVGGSNGGWTIGTNSIYKDSTIDNTPYRTMMYAPDNPVKGNAAFAVRYGAGTTASPYKYPFLVNYGGYLQAIGGGKIGTWTLEDGEDGALYNGMTSISDTTHNGVYIGKDGIALGKGKFKVLADGTLSATGAVIDGTITTGSGSVGGWGITSTLLQKYTEEVQNGDQYNVFMQAPSSPTTASRAFGVQKRTFTSGEAGDWSNVFYVDYSGKLYATNAQITGGINGGWTIGTNAIYKDSTIGGVSHRTMLYAPDTPTSGNAAFAIRAGEGTTASPYKWPFLVRYNGFIQAIGGGKIGTWTLEDGEDGALYNGMTSISDTTHNGVYIGKDGIALGKGKFKVLADGTLSATGATIDGSIVGETINVGGTGNITATSGTPPYTRYRNLISTGDESATTSGTSYSYKNVSFSAELLQGTTSKESASLKLSPTAGFIATLKTANNSLKFGFALNTETLLELTDSRAYIKKDIEAKGDLNIDGTINGHAIKGTKLYETSTALEDKYNRIVTGMNADGPSSAVSIPKDAWTEFTDTYQLMPNHKYYVTYAVEFANNATGIRASRAIVSGTSAGIISLDRRTAISGYSTYTRAGFWIQPSSSSTAMNLKFEVYQNSGGALNATLRYQVIDFGE